MPLPDSFLDELVARCDIYDVVSRYVPLKKSGANYFGVCPFHNEKTPSFSVSRDKQIYHCFGCGAGGGVINFIMRIENMTFPEAVRHLAKRAGHGGARRAWRAPDAQKRARREAAATWQPTGRPGLPLFGHARRRGPTGWTISAEGGCPPAPSPGLAWALPPRGGTA